MNLGLEALKIAISKLGIKEATGNNDGVFVVMLQRWLDAGAGWMEHQPWCATFATWCIYQAAKPLGLTPKIPRCGSSTSLYAWGKQNGQLLAAPVPGCIGLMKGSGGTPGKTHHHTFLVEQVHLAEGYVNGVDGNWRNAVSRTRHLIAECDFLGIS
jgi:hypothetical protein